MLALLLNSALLLAVSRMHMAIRYLHELWAPTKLPAFKLMQVDGTLVESRGWEYEDQLILYRHVRPDDRVLVLGGNIGGACIAVDRILGPVNGKHAACVEPNPTLHATLEGNRAANLASFRIVRGVVADAPLYLNVCNRSGVGTCSTTSERRHSQQAQHDDAHEAAGTRGMAALPQHLQHDEQRRATAGRASHEVAIPNIQLRTLEREMGFGPSESFTFLHLDCEGCACTFLTAHANLLASIRGVVLEQDGSPACNKQASAALEQAGLRRVDGMPRTALKEHLRVAAADAQFLEANHSSSSSSAQGHHPSSTAKRVGATAHRITPRELFPHGIWTEYLRPADIEEMVRRESEPARGTSRRPGAERKAAVQQRRAEQLGYRRLSQATAAATTTTTSSSSITSPSLSSSSPSSAAACEAAPAMRLGTPGANESSAGLAFPTRPSSIFFIGDSLDRNAVHLACGALHSPARPYILADFSGMGLTSYDYCLRLGHGLGGSHNLGGNSIGSGGHGDHGVSGRGVSGRGGNSLGSIAASALRGTEGSGQLLLANFMHYGVMPELPLWHTAYRHRRFSLGAPPPLANTSSEHITQDATRIRRVLTQKLGHAQQGHTRHEERGQAADSQAVAHAVHAHTVAHTVARNTDAHAARDPSLIVASSYLWDLSQHWMNHGNFSLSFMPSSEFITSWVSNVKQWLMLLRQTFPTSLLAWRTAPPAMAGGARSPALFQRMNDAIKEMLSADPAFGPAPLGKPIVIIDWGARMHAKHVDKRGRFNGRTYYDRETHPGAEDSLLLIRMALRVLCSSRL